MAVFHHSGTGSQFIHRGQGNVNVNTGNGIQFNGRMMVFDKDGNLVEEASTVRQPAPKTPVYFSGEFDQAAENFVYVPTGVRAFPEGVESYQNTDHFAASIPIVVGEKHVYVSPDGDLVVLGPDFEEEVLKDDRVTIDGTTVSIDDFEKVPVAFVPYKKKDRRTDKHTKPSNCCPPESSPYEPIAYERFLVYYDGTNFLVYGENYSNTSVSTADNHVLFSNGGHIKLITSDSFKPVRIDK